MSSEGEFDVDVRGPGITFHRRVVGSIAARVMHLALAGEGPDAASIGLFQEKVTDQSELQLSPKNSKVSPRLSFREFLDSCAPKSDSERVTAAIAYLAEHRSGTKADRSAIEAAFRDAGESVPGNTRDAMLNAKRRGWIAPNPGKRAGYYLTNTGRKAMTSNFAKTTR